MDCRAAVLTGRGTAALATLMVAGEDAERLLREILTTAPPPLGASTLCHIQDRHGSIDQIVVGHETPGRFALHTHGNPLIVERIMGGLRAQGAQLVEGQDLWDERASGIEAEIDRALAQTRTLLGARLLNQQRKHGLLPLLRGWRDDCPTLPECQAACRTLLARYQPARTLIHGCRVVLIGPPNSGKSTLFNRLLGVEKSLVTDLEGTTRDWVEGELTLPDLHLHLFDTAGLDPQLAQREDGHLDRSAQDRALGLLDEADIYLLVLDNSQRTDPTRSLPLKQLPAHRSLVALNKSDLPARLDAGVTCRFPHVYPISAKQDTGLTDLIEGLRSVCGTANLDINLPTPFTARQRDLLTTLAQTTNPSEAQGTVRTLLYGNR